MSESAKTTIWTDTQLQDFLDTSKERLSYETLFYELPDGHPATHVTYLLVFDNQVITLTEEQALKVKYWLRIYFPNFSFTSPVVPPLEKPSARDTQFLGFAQLLMDDLLAESEGYCLLWDSEGNKGGMKRIQQQIAQRAYDFLVNSAYSSSLLDSWRTSLERVSRVPDMTQWPPNTPSPLSF